MKRRIVPLLLAVLLFGLQAVGTTASADQRRLRPRRTVVVVHRGFPILRAPRLVVVRPLLHPFLVAPRLFLPVVFWGGIVATAAMARPLVIWEDGETLSADEDWTEFSLNCANTGSRLWLEIVSGRARFDWAEVTFANGEAQVVDMKEFVRDPGFYPLLDFANGRAVDHVRVVAKSETPESRVVLKMEK